MNSWRIWCARGVEPAITASTGIAATHIGGMTIHRGAASVSKQRLNTEDLGVDRHHDYIAKRVRREGADH